MIKKLSRGAAKHLRQEKGRIRREFSDETVRAEAIKKLCQKMGCCSLAVDSSPTQTP